MKRTVRLALLGAVLHGGAHAGEPVAQSAPVATPGEAKASAVQPQAPTRKKQKPVRGKNPRVTAKADGSAGESKRNGAPEAPTDQVEQSVQLKGVRG